MSWRNLFGRKKPQLTESQRRLGQALFPGGTLEEELMRAELTVETEVAIAKIILDPTKKIAYLVGHIPNPSFRLTEFGVPHFFEAEVSLNGEVSNIYVRDTLSGAYFLLNYMSGSFEAFDSKASGQKFSWHVEEAQVALQRLLRELDEQESA